MNEAHTAEIDAGRPCPKCLGLGGWPCHTAMPHYVIRPEVFPVADERDGSATTSVIPPA